MPRGRASNLIGQTFGRLTVVALSNRSTKHGRYWICRCSCPSSTEKEVRGDNLNSGKVTSCGCYLQEIRDGQIDGVKVGRRPGDSLDRRFDEDPRYQAMSQF